MSADVPRRRCRSWRLFGRRRRWPAGRRARRSWRASSKSATTAARTSSPCRHATTALYVCREGGSFRAGNMPPAVCRMQCNHCQDRAKYCCLLIMSHSGVSWRLGRILVLHWAELSRHLCAGRRAVAGRVADHWAGRVRGSVRRPAHQIRVRHHSGTPPPRCSNPKPTCCSSAYAVSWQRSAGLGRANAWLPCSRLLQRDFARMWRGCSPVSSQRACHILLRKWDGGSA